VRRAGRGGDEVEMEMVNTPFGRGDFGIDGVESCIARVELEHTV